MSLRNVLFALVILILATALLPPTGASAQVAESPDAVHPLLIGSQVPELTLRTPEGKSFELSAAIAEGPTVLIFYRGGW